MTDTISIDGDRLWSRLEDMAGIGPTPGGGANRQALSAEDTEARRLLLSWTAARDYTAFIDAIGNLFIRRPGADPEAAPAAMGSHLDTQPKGGHYDGIYGVLAGLEVLESLDDQGIQTERPLELVVWMNEEGSRFPPTTMGSAVFTGALSLDDTLATRDADGVSVGEALAESLAALGDIGSRALGAAMAAFVEIHIEQGPVLEGENLPIGVVTGVQGLRWFTVEIEGEAGHAGTTPQDGRKDALKTAAHVIEVLHADIPDASADVRFTIGRLHVEPGSPNTIPRRVAFSIDLRDPSEETLIQASERIQTVCREEAGPCEVTVHREMGSPPTTFDPDIGSVIRDAATRHGFGCMPLMSGATHDAKLVASHCPTGMIFIPCKDGISHSERESITREHADFGAQVLADVMLRLSS